MAARIALAVAFPAALLYHPAGSQFDAAIGKLVGSTLLLDYSLSADPHADPAKTEPPKPVVHTKNPDVSLADVLFRFPAVASKWERETFSKFQLEQIAGIHCGRASVVWGGTVTEEIFGKRYPDIPWALDGVMEDMNCLYLQVSKRSPDEIRENKIVCIPPRRTRTVKAHYHIKPFYLIAGTFESLALQSFALGSRMYLLSRYDRIARVYDNGILGLYA